MARFEFKKNEIKQFFENLDSQVPFTTDCWTSPNNLAFMGVTAHYIDKDWNIQATCLDFLPLSDAHTGSNLHESFVRVLNTFGLSSKVLGVTLDNASNNDCFIEKLSSDSETSFKSFHHIRCFAHVLNLAAQAALVVLKDDLIKLRNAIKKIRSSPQSYMKFKELQNNSDLKPILDCPTRWNSTADMLERALKLKDSLIAFSSIFDSGKKASEELLSLSLNSWTNFEKIFEYLLPFRKATLMVCGETYPSISLIVPLYNKLMDHLRLWMVEKSIPSEALHRSIVSANAKIIDYYNLTRDCYTISTVLDPRFKLEYYKQGKGDSESSQEIVNAAYQRFYAPEPNLEEPKEPLLRRKYLL